MKTSCSLPAFLLALAGLSVFALAEETKPKITGSLNASKPEVIAALDFESATLGEIVNSLRKLTGGNIVMAPALRDMKAPDIELMNVTFGGVMQAIAGAMPDVLVTPSVDVLGATCWSLAPRPEAGNVRPEARIVRIFKASAKERPVGPQLDELLKNISDAARKFCQLNAKAQGRPEAEAPTIEVHAGTGILAVLGTEAEVQIVGQVIQALGGEAVPFTSSVDRASSTVPFRPNAGVTGISTVPDGTAGSLTLSTKDDPGNTFVNAYMMVQAAEKAEQNGELLQAIKKFESAATLFAQIATTWPDWQPKIVEYRKKRTAEALSRVRQWAEPPPTSKTPAAPASTTPASAPDSPENFTAKLEELRKQLDKAREQLDQAREISAEAAKKNEELQAQREAIQKKQEAVLLEKAAPPKVK